MAIEIIPKPKTRPKISISFLGIVQYLIVFFSLALFLSYFGLIVLSQKRQGQLKEIEAKIGQEKEIEIALLESKALAMRDRLDVFSELLNNHQSAAVFFPFVSGLSHQQVVFTSLDLNLIDWQVKLTGRAESFDVLQEQILIFQQEPMIKKIDLLSINRSQEGKIEFGLTLLLDPRLFLERDIFKKDNKEAEKETFLPKDQLICKFHPWSLDLGQPNNV